MYGHHEKYHGKPELNFTLMYDINQVLNRIHIWYKTIAFQSREHAFYSIQFMEKKEEKTLNALRCAIQNLKKKTHLIEPIKDFHSIL